MKAKTPTIKRFKKKGGLRGFFVSDLLGAIKQTKGNIRARRHGRLHKRWENEYVVSEETGRICGHLGCPGMVIRTEGEHFWSVTCEKCGWGCGGSK